MSKPVAARLRLILILFSLLLGSACTGGLTSRPAPQTGTGFSGSLEGRLYLDPKTQSLSLHTSGKAPAGLNPVSGASVNVAGKAAVSTNQQGYFRLDDLPLGLQDVTFKSPSGQSLTRQATVLYQSLVDLGEPAFSRAAAYALVRQTLGQDEDARNGILVLAPLQPLPAGLTVTQALAPDGSTKAPIRSFATPQWFFYVNPKLGSRFSHAVDYYFVDATNGRLQVQSASAWPLLNGFEYARDEYSLLDSPEAIDPPPRALASTAPAASLAALKSFRIADHVPGCPEPKHLVLLIHGEHRPDVDKDAENVSAALSKQPRTKVTVFPSFAYTDPTSELGMALSKIYASLTPCDTFTLYFTGHGVENGGMVLQKKLKLGENYVLRPVESETNYTNYSDTVYANNFKLKTIPACHINLIVEACYSGYHATSEAGLSFKSHLTEMTGRKAMVLAAATASQESTADDDNGGTFTRTLLEALQNPALDRNRDGQVSLPEAGAEVEGKRMSSHGWIRRRFEYHTPVMWIRNPEPGENCAPPQPSPSPGPSATPTPLTPVQPSPSSRPTEEPSSQPSAIRPPGSAQILFDNTNIGGVESVPEGPCAPSFQLKSPSYITEIFHYHWNMGKGAPAGKISLRASNGKLYGPWQVVPGQGGASNRDWLVQPNALLPAGSYTAVDSDPGTWSRNPDSGNCGFVRISGIPVQP